ncbi:MAG: hypothetical protein DMG70_28885 [Acidobacteria bacterium]|nr:MAG: hypothetical protein DMG70_28885 [Acidobacteriota bacterium]
MFYCVERAVLARQPKEKKVMRDTAIWFGLLFFFLISLPIAAQNERGSILGHVMDSSGAAIAGAKVTVRNENTGIGTTFLTTSTGDYVVVNLIPGIYDVSVENEGFQIGTAKGLVLQVDQTLRQNFTMQVGTVQQQIEVSANAQMLQSDNATIGGVITDRQIHSLPISGRDFTNLLATSAGVTQASGGIQATLFDPHGLNTQFTSVSVDGARPACRHDPGVQAAERLVLRPVRFWFQPSQCRHQVGYESTARWFVRFPGKFRLSTTEPSEYFPEVANEKFSHTHQAPQQAKSIWVAIRRTSMDPQDLRGEKSDFLVWQL